MKFGHEIDPTLGHYLKETSKGKTKEVRPGQERLSPKAEEAMVDFYDTADRSGLGETKDGHQLVIDLLTKAKAVFNEAFPMKERLATSKNPGKKNAGKFVKAALTTAGIVGSIVAAEAPPSYAQSKGETVIGVLNSINRMSENASRERIERERTRAQATIEMTRTLAYQNTERARIDGQVAIEKLHALNRLAETQTRGNTEALRGFIDLINQSNLIKTNPELAAKLLSQMLGVLTPAENIDGAKADMPQSQGFKSPIQEAPPREK